MGSICEGLIYSVWKSRSYVDALNEDPINLYIFWKLNSYRIQSDLWNFLKRQCRSDIKRNNQKHCFALIGKYVFDFPDVVWSFFYNLLKFDIVNADIPFY